MRPVVLALLLAVAVLPPRPTAVHPTDGVQTAQYTACNPRLQQCR